MCALSGPLIVCCRDVWCACYTDLSQSLFVCGLTHYYQLKVITNEHRGFHEATLTNRSALNGIRSHSSALQIISWDLPCRGRARRPISQHIAEISVVTMHEADLSAISVVWPASTSSTRRPNFLVGDRTCLAGRTSPAGDISGDRTSACRLSALWRRAASSCHASVPSSSTPPATPHDDGTSPKRR